MAKEKAVSLATVKEDALMVGGKPLGFISENEDPFEGQQVTHMLSLDGIPGIRGIFEGKGEDVEMTDPTSGELRAVGTWVVRISKTVRMQFATSSQLDSKLKNYPVGEVVTIKKLSESRRSRAGRVVSQYLVSDPPQKA